MLAKIEYINSSNVEHWTSHTQNRYLELISLSAPLMNFHSGPTVDLGTLTDSASLAICFFQL